MHSRRQPHDGIRQDSEAILGNDGILTGAPKKRGREMHDERAR